MALDIPFFGQAMARRKLDRKDTEGQDNAAAEPVFVAAPYLPAVHCGTCEHWTASQMGPKWPGLCGLLPDWSRAQWRKSDSRCAFPWGPKLEVLAKEYWELSGLLLWEIVPSIDDAGRLVFSGAGCRNAQVREGLKKWLEAGGDNGVTKKRELVQAIRAVYAQD